MKNILITGGAGFIGYHLSKALLNKNFNIDIFDNLSRGKLDKDLKKLLKNNKINFKKVDLNKPFFIKKNYQYIFHLAATVGVKNVNINPSLTIYNNIMPLFSMINFINKKNIKTKIILFSTSEVYSPLLNDKKKFPFSEKNSIPLSNKVISRDSYFLSKLFSEKIIKISNLDFIILRPHNIYGPRMGFAHVIPEIIEKFKKEKTVKVYSPNHTRSFCYIDDAINQIVNLSINNKFKNNIYNIGNDMEEIKIIDLVKKIAHILKSNKKIQKKESTIGSPPRRRPNLKKIKKLINIKSVTNLNDGLKKTIKWYYEKI